MLHCDKSIVLFSVTLIYNKISLQYTISLSFAMSLSLFMVLTWFNVALKQYIVILDQFL